DAILDDLVTGVQTCALPICSRRACGRASRTMTLGLKSLHMRVDYNPYEGREVTGVTDTVISRGKVVIDGGTFVGKAGAGSFLKRSEERRVGGEWWWGRGREG